ncbi:MAG TPA: Uma2 family endonuclease [Herpetosiphonaceae bacterium]
MVEAGILQEHDLVELIDGEILEMIPIGSCHAACVNRLNTLLTRRLGDRAIISVQNPIRLNDYSEPEPDIAVLQPCADFYAAAHPSAEDVLLVIEVAETSLEYDREVKIPRYAQADIPEVWLLDVQHEIVMVYTQPRHDAYQMTQIVRGAELVQTAILGGLAIRADEILAQ